MADVNDKGLFLSVLDELSRGGDIARNLLGGRLPEAGREFGQGVLNNIDAMIPGNWLPDDFASESDHLSGHDLLKQYGVDTGDGFLGKAAGFAVDTLTDPLTYVPGGVFKKGLSAVGGIARSGAAKVVGEEALQAAGRNIRSTFGASRLSPAIADALAKARATQSGVSQAGIKSLDEMLKGTTQEQQDLVGEIMHNLRREGGRVVGPIDPTEALPLRERAMARLAGRPDAEQLANLAEDVSAFNKRQFAAGKDELGIFTDGKGVEEYFPRKFSGVKAGDVTEDAFGRPSIIRGRKLESSGDVSKFLSENPDVSLEFNAQRALADRALKQGESAGRASIGKSLVGDGFRLADDASRAQVDEAIKSLPLEEREVVESMYKGLPPRGFLTSVLNKSNRLWKPMVTGGWMLPSVAFNVRNRISGIWQTFTTDSARAGTAGMAARTASDLAGAVADAIGANAPDKVGKILREWDSALASSGGSYKKALDTLRAGGNGVAADLIENNAIDGFVSAEEMISAAHKGGLLGKIQRAGEWPSKIVQGLEQRMRLGLGADLVASGMAPKEAAAAVREAMFDYSTNSAKNRAFRDAFSFGQYPAKALVQQAKFFSSRPYATSALANAMPDGTGEDITYPWQDGKLNIPIGDHQFITGLGLPFEAAGMLPNPSGSINEVGDQIERNVIGNANPLLKTVYGAVAGHDPNFSSTFGSYSRLPVIGEAGEFGRLANVAIGAGLGQQAVSPLRTINGFVDDRKTVGQRLLDSLSGVNILTVDPDRAMQDRITKALELSPGVIQARTPINGSGDPETAQLIQELRDLKARQKAKRLAEVQKGSVL